MGKKKKRKKKWRMKDTNKNKNKEKDKRQAPKKKKMNSGISSTKKYKQWNNQDSQYHIGRYIPYWYEY